MNKKALIFGITGQDGAYLAKTLLKKKYLIYGITRNKNYRNLKKLNLLNKIRLFNFSSFDNPKIMNLFKKNFDEIYYLAGQSSVKDSFNKITSTYKSQILPLKNILDYIVKQNGKKTKFLYAGSSEIFGNVNKQKKINEDSFKKPVSPYGMSKLIGYEIIKSYRSMFKIPVCTAILFNHESPLRPKSFVFKKIIDNIKDIKKNSKKKLRIGNINIKRDWGWGPEYMIGCHKIINSKKIDDYIIATGKTVSLKKIIELSFHSVNLDWKKYTIIEKRNFRKFEIKENYSNISKLKKQVKWTPKIDYLEVIKRLFEKEL